MQFQSALELLLVHCQGEIGKIIVGGAPEIPGATILEKMNHINAVDDSLRRFVTFEPRGHVAMTVNLLLPPCRPDADAGFIVLQPDRAHPMSGSNAICVVTALLETGRVAMVEPETVVRLDTAAGLITARARCEKGRCLSVSLDNVPAFAVELDRVIDGAEQAPLSKADRDKLKDALHALVESLEQRRNTEKTSAVLGDQKDNPATEPAPPDAGKSKSAGHGRNGAEAFRGAEKVEIAHQQLHSGDRCPDCARGNVYEQKEPKVLVRIVGQAPLAATVYELERLRCNG